MENNITDFSYLGNDPGATKYGNFINYYEFHTPVSRINALPRNVWCSKTQKTFVCLDVGCNSGDLTKELYKFVSAELNGKNSENPSVNLKSSKTQCYFLGVDLDPTLIKRAEENNNYINEIQYKCVNIMSAEYKEIVGNFLESYHKILFDVVFCFSLTMWIHLNNGDEGLKSFLKDVCAVAKVLVIEPQPWQCYRRAVRRLKRAASETFPLFETLKIRGNVELEIENIITECNFEKVMESPQLDWGRRIVIYHKSENN